MWMDYVDLELTAKKFQNLSLLINICKPKTNNWLPASVPLKPFSATTTLLHLTLSFGKQRAATLSQRGLLFVRTRSRRKSNNDSKYGLSCRSVAVEQKRTVEAKIVLWLAHKRLSWERVNLWLSLFLIVCPSACLYYPYKRVKDYCGNSLVQSTCSLILFRVHLFVCVCVCAFLSVYVCCGICVWTKGFVCLHQKYFWALRLYWPLHRRIDLTLANL